MADIQQGAPRSHETANSSHAQSLAEKDCLIARLEAQIAALKQGAGEDLKGRDGALESQAKSLEEKSRIISALSRQIIGESASEGDQSARQLAVDDGATLLRVGAVLSAQQKRKGLQVWSAWSGQPSPRRRAASFTRSRPLFSILRRLALGRAAVLLTSGLYNPIDGSHASTIISYSKGSDQDAHPLFDAQWYTDHTPQLAGNKSVAAIHYLVSGDLEKRDPHPLFDSSWYRETYSAECNGWPLTTLEHYILRGAKGGTNPHPLFDTMFYVVQAADHFERGGNPLAHYLSEGWRKGLNPHPLFDNDWYLSRYPEVARAETPPLLHYATRGWREGFNPHPLFDAAYYSGRYRDIDSSMSPLAHYLQRGWRDSRQTSPYFDPKAYIEANPDVAASGADPLTHYLTQGAWESRAIPGYDLSSLACELAEDLLAGRTPIESRARRANPGPASTALAAPGGDVLFRELYVSARVADENSYGWPNYIALNEMMVAGEKSRIQSVAARPRQILDLDQSDLEKEADKLVFEHHATPRVSIIVPVFNQIKFTLECLKSLSQAQSEATYEIIVADDCSTDETSQILARTRGVKVKRQVENVGFLLNVNSCVAEARGEIVLILNNDVQVSDGWLDPLLVALEDPGVGLVAPKLLFPNGRLQEAGARVNVDGSSRMIGVFDDPDLPRYNYARDVDYVSGACIALRRDDFLALGGFSLEYAPAYYEDCDLCLRLRQSGKRIRYEPASVVYHHLSVTSNATSKVYKAQQILRNKQKLVERWQDFIESSNSVRIISFYLPQFHQVPENDRWWGAGFTEWRNVQRALPNYSGHYQPHRPAELGFYDLSNADVMERQADLAKAHGVHGFCYYYYSFSGRRILEKPLEAMLSSGKPDLPFCICWANENWTRRWDGGDKAVLLSQTYAPEDDVKIIEDMIRYLRSPHYIRVNGRPLLVMYRPQLLPNARETAETWRRVCREAGVGEIYLAMVEVFEHARNIPTPKDWGFDATIEFPPAGMAEQIDPPGALLNPEFKGVVSDYNSAARNYLREPVPGFTRFRGVMPSWDNTARRQDDSYSFAGASPGAFQAWLEAVIEQTRDQNYGDERIVFVNAWNEWAEGAHLEPDEKFGRGWLEAVRNAQLPDALAGFRRKIEW